MQNRIGTPFRTGSGNETHPQRSPWHSLVPRRWLHLVIKGPRSGNETKSWPLEVAHLTSGTLFVSDERERTPANDNRFPIGQFDRSVGVITGDELAE